MTDTSAWVPGSNDVSGAAATAAHTGAQGIPSAFSSFFHGILSNTIGKVVVVIILIIAGFWLIKFVGEELT